MLTGSPIVTTETKPAALDTGENDTMITVDIELCGDGTAVATARGATVLFRVQGQLARKSQVLFEDVTVKLFDPEGL